LNNSEIIHYIHSKKHTKKFGYVYLCTDNAYHNYFVYGSSSKLYEDLLESIEDAKHTNVSGEQGHDVVERSENAVKEIGYYVILNDSDIISELHIPL